ncbi:MAG TPA: hypothetical protein VIJ14_05160 [Rhabdochlamydiaceae bacterium]
MSYKFTHESNSILSQYKQVKTFEMPNGATLDDLLVLFKGYLIACGFEVPGEVTIVNIEALNKVREYLENK